MKKQKKKLALNKWRDKYGVEILITEMSDRHLICAVRCYERYSKEREERLRQRLAAIMDGQGDVHIRQEAATKLTALDDEGFSITKAFPRYPLLCAEALKRGLI